MPRFEISRSNLNVSKVNLAPRQTRLNDWEQKGRMKSADVYYKSEREKSLMMKKILGLTFAAGLPQLAKRLICSAISVVSALLAMVLAASFVPAMPAATALMPDAQTVVLDHFDKTTKGVQFGNPTYGVGIVNQAVNLTAGTYIQYPVPTSLETAGTIEMWLNLNTYSVGIMDFNWNNTTAYPAAGHVLHFQVGVDGKLTTGGWALNPANMYSLSSLASVPLGQWSHVAFSYSSSGSKLYINGVLSASSTQSFQPAGPQYAYLHYWGAQSLGYVDELRISNVQRTDAQIQADAAGGCSCGSSTGPTIPGGDGTPSVVLNSVPPKGSTAQLTGTVLHVQPADYYVAIFIRVFGGWWTKPYFNDPKTSIAPDGRAMS